MSQKTYLAKVTVRGQVAIPKEVRQLLDIKPGDYIAFIVKDNTVTIKKAKITIEQ